MNRYKQSLHISKGPRILQMYMNVHVKVFVVAGSMYSSKWNPLVATLQHRDRRRVRSGVLHSNERCRAEDINCCIERLCRLLCSTELRALEILWVMAWLPVKEN